MLVHLTHLQQKPHSQSVGEVTHSTPWTWRSLSDSQLCNESTSMKPIALPSKHWTNTGVILITWRTDVLPVVMGTCSPVVSPHKVDGSINLQTPHHNSRQKKVSFNGIPFQMNMAIICEPEHPIVQVVAAVFSA